MNLQPNIEIPRAAKLTRDSLRKLINQVEGAARKYVTDSNTESYGGVDVIGNGLSDLSSVLKTDEFFSQTVGISVDLCPASNDPMFYLTISLYRPFKFANLVVEIWSAKMYDYDVAFQTKKQIEQHFFW